MYSNKPYLIRAFNDWIVDSGLTPYLAVNAEQEDVRVPREYVKNGQIILNIKPAAVKNLYLGMRKISFNATFSGEVWDIIVPVVAITAIYAAENGEGMMFDEFDDAELPPEPTEKSQGAHFRLVDDE